MQIARIVAAVLMFSIASSVSAQATYTYTGQPYDTFSAGTNPFSSANSVNGSCTVDSVLADGAYNFSALAT